MIKTFILTASLLLSFNLAKATESELVFDGELYALYNSNGDLIGYVPAEEETLDMIIARAGSEDFNK